jgi:hypothetical protein
MEADMTRWIAGSLAGLVLLAACATSGGRDSEAKAYERYMDFAGAPIDEFTYMGRYYGWEDLGRNVIAVRTGNDEAYVLKLMGPCPHLDLAHGIALTSWAHTVRRGTDSVRVGGDVCRISEIRPVDYHAMRAADAKERQSDASR